MKTLKEVEEMVGLTRRQIQYFEREEVGLSPKPTERDEKGGYLYDEATISRLILLKLYKDEGRSTAWMKRRISDPSFDQREEMRRHVKVLEKRVKAYQAFIDTAKYFERYNVTPDKVYFAFQPLLNISFDRMISLFSHSKLSFDPENFKFPEIDDDDFERCFQEEDADRIMEYLETVKELKENGTMANSYEIQKTIKKLVSPFAEAFSDSSILLRGTIELLSNDRDIKEDLDSELGDGYTEYLFKAIAVYAQNNESVFDQELKDSVLNIEKIFRRHCSPSSDEAQLGIRKIYELYSKAKILSKKHKLTIMSNYMTCFFNQLEVAENEEERDLYKFLGRAIEIFYENEREENE